MPMDTSLKQRLVGAVVLIALAVIFLPMLVKGPAPDSGVSDVAIEVPPEPKAADGMVTQDLPLVAPDGANVTVSLAQDGDGHRIDITISYSDGRFARMPFLPDLSQIAPVTVEYRLTDPLG